MSAEHKLLDAYEKISSSKITERGSGLNDLKQLLTQKRNAGNLNDKGFHKMYETIFKAAVLEKSLYTKQSRSTLRGISSSRLQTCGAVLRAAVELGVEHLKVKTVRAVYNHIIDILPSGEKLCEPLSVDYVKALRVLFQYAPHTEHLLSDEWAVLAEFCCTNVKSQLGLPDEKEEEEEPEVEAEDRSPHVRETVLLRESSSTSRRSAAGGSQQQFTARLTHESEQLLLCLRNLLAAPNAPILAHIQMICDTLLGFLRSQRTYTRAHQHVFSSLNFVLNVVTTNNLALVNKVSVEIVPIINRLWDTKTPGLKDEMIISLIHCHPHIRARIRRTEGRVLRTSIENLFEDLCSEYIARSDREILQLDDVTFPSPTGRPDSEVPLSLRAIALRTNVQNARAEQMWMIPSLIAMVVEMLDASSDSGRRSRKKGETEGNRPKRQRMYDRFGELMRFVRSNNTPRKLLALQVITFLADLKGINEQEFPSIVQDLLEACSDDNPAITAWALTSIGR
ncbi:hypothetical protein K440DRAFT_203298 [Wilcoxina mikolae CBS 423.85]|nr:hypothetical protein K440DRAFT_203298 [Wilcoxina mikolae CBS 423.85]